MAESIDDIWADDLLDRRSDAELLLTFLQRRHAERQEAGQKGAYVVNLNAAWGHGKTFFMERLERQMRAGGHLTAFVNAWRDDTSREPVVAVMAAIEESLKPHFAKEDAAAKAWAAAKANSATILASLGKGAFKQLLRKGIGEGLDEVEKILNQEEFVSEDVERELTKNADKVGDAVVKEVTSLLTTYVDQKITDYQTRVTGAAEFQNRMRQVLASLGEKETAKLPFFVLIDELDRCRPTYAIEMLEQVKHLFDVDNTIFLIATDGDQLSHSIKAVYGEGFDGKRYLLRFFHRHYRFEERDTAAFVKYLFETNKIDLNKIGTPLKEDPVHIFVGAMEEYSVTLRDAEQCFDLLRSIVTTWEYPVPIELSVMLPLILRFHAHDHRGMEAYLLDDSPVDAESKWAIEVVERDAFRRVSARRTTPVQEFNRALLRRARSSLENIYDYNRGAGPSTYTAEVLQQEFERVHRQTLTPGGPMSIILDYPKIVRRVGRLANDQPS